MNSYTHGVSTTELLGDTIGDNLDRAVAAWPEREALVDVPSGRRWTYARFGADVDELASALLASGVAKGDRVGIWAVNCPEWVLVQYATARIGAIMVNINPAYRTHEVEYVLNQAGISCCSPRSATRAATTGRWSTKCAAGAGSCGRSCTSATRAGGVAGARRP